MSPAVLTGGSALMENPVCAQFDWYQGTMDSEAILHPLDLFGVLGDVAPRPIPGVNGYSRGWEILKENQTMVRVYEGHGKEPHFISTGSYAGTIASTVRSSGRNNHRVSRADVCIDLLNGPYLFQQLQTDFKRMFPNITQKTITSKSPKGPTASTLYLGASQSAMTVRIYEKGKEDASYHPDTVRVEVQYRPDSRDKSAASTLEPIEYFGQSRWTNKVLERIAGYKTVAAPPRSKGVSTAEASMEAMMKQYGGRMKQFFIEDCGSDIDQFEHFFFDRFPAVVRGLE